MEIPKYWRTTHQRMRLEGYVGKDGHPTLLDKPDFQRYAGSVAIQVPKGEVFNAQRIISSAMAFSKSSK